MTKSQLVTSVKDMDKVITQIKCFDNSEHSVAVLRQKIQAMIRVNIGYGTITKAEGDELKDAYGYCFSTGRDDSWIPPND